MDTFLPHHLKSSASLLTKTGLTRNADQDSNWLYSLAIQDMESHISVLRWQKKKNKNSTNPDVFMSLSKALAATSWHLD